MSLSKPAHGKRPASASGPTLRSAPRTFAELLAWASQNRVAMDGHDRAEGSRLLATMMTHLEDGLGLTTSYSGHGTAEYSATEVHRDADAHCEGPLPAIVLHAACDNNATAQKALQNHARVSRPLHLFPDLLTRVDHSTRERLLELQGTVHAQVQQALEDLEKEQLSTKERRDKFKDIIKRYARKLVRGSRALLLDAIVMTDDTCIQCGPGSRCPLAPNRRDVKFWVEIAGMTCTAFSPMGSQWRWADASSLPCLVWAFWVRAAQPDIALAECVGQFETGPIEEILDHFVFYRIDLCPSLLGWPARRIRFYGAWFQVKL